ncbi:unnamed protein product [Durusdinium trenchii]|uniref:Amidase domain-containing protein n=1 Tax=Durusdinium trenchii TaxID=1381693 RepID=A0ABP0PHM3_9DINO
MLRSIGLWLAISGTTCQIITDHTCADADTNRSRSFPPRGLAPPAVAQWFREALPPRWSGRPLDSTARERQLARWSAAEYMAARKKGEVSCEEYVSSLVKRAKHYREMNQFMNWDNDPHWTERVLDHARRLDAQAAQQGIDTLAPLYGLPLPMKGTMATKEFISSAGSGVLHHRRAREDAEFVKLVVSKHGIVFGKTNVPDFAASLLTCNYANGCTLNPHAPLLTSGGSSGGAGSAVASYLAPVAVSEDTGGSTRSPAFSNGIFGYDPTRGHYPNAGNPGMSLILDQLGLNARSLKDLVALDGALCDYDPSSVPEKKIQDLRIGVPIYPFVEAYVPSGGDNPWGFAEYPTAWVPSREILAKYEAAKVALRAAGAQVVEKEWPSEEGTNVLAKAFFLMKMAGEAVSPYYHSFGTFSGQVAQWIHDYLGADDVSIADVIAHARSAGLGHTPGRFMELELDETKFSFILQELRLAGQAAWNRLFDQEDLDLILVPGFLHVPTYDCVASSTCEHQVKNLTSGEIRSSAEFSSLHQIFMHSLSMKHIPLPKMMIPAGLDASQHPVGLQMMGRAGPKGTVGLGYSYDAEALKTVAWDRKGSSGGL